MGHNLLGRTLKVNGKYIFEYGRCENVLCHCRMNSILVLALILDTVVAKTVWSKFTLYANKQFL